MFKVDFGLGKKQKTTKKAKAMLVQGLLGKKQVRITPMLLRALNF